MSTEQMALTTVEGPLVKREETPRDQAAQVLAILSSAVTDPRFDVDKMARLMDLYDQTIRRQSEASFMAALSRLQAKVPQIDRHGVIIVKGQERSRYAKLEDIDTAIRPLLNDEGFAFSFDTETTDTLIRLSCKLSHRDGHAETKTLLLPIDASEFRSKVQNVGSAVSYGKRQLIKMWLNIVECDEDNDGLGGFITEDQATNIEALLTEVKASREGFLRFMGVDKIESISFRDYQKAINALEVKRRART